MHLAFDAAGPYLKNQQVVFSSWIYPHPTGSYQRSQENTDPQATLGHQHTGRVLSWRQEDILVSCSRDTNRSSAGSGVDFAATAARWLRPDMRNAMDDMERRTGSGNDRRIRTHNVG